MEPRNGFLFGALVVLLPEAGGAHSRRPKKAWAAAGSRGPTLSASVEFRPPLAPTPRRLGVTPLDSPTESAHKRRRWRGGTDVHTLTFCLHSLLAVTLWKSWFTTVNSLKGDCLYSSFFFFFFLTGGGTIGHQEVTFSLVQKNHKKGS